MVKKYDALDWQSFSQKKDIEEIVKNTKEKNDIQITATIEIAMAVSSIIAPQLFDDNLPAIWCILILIISAIPLLWLAIKKIKKLYNKIKVGSDIPHPSDLIDLFDNDICYYVLMAESYSDKLSTIDLQNISNVDQFYYIETCFYTNKAIHNLSNTSNCVDRLFSIDWVELYANRKISYTRLKNIFYIIDECIRKIESYSVIIECIDKDSNYKILCQKYKQSYHNFKQLFKDIDPEYVEIKL